MRLLECRHRLRSTPFRRCRGASADHSYARPATGRCNGEKARTANGAVPPSPIADRGRHLCLWTIMGNDGAAWWGGARRKTKAAAVAADIVVHFNRQQPYRSGSGIYCNRCCAATDCKERDDEPKTDSVGHHGDSVAGKSTLTGGIDRFPQAPPLGPVLRTWELRHTSNAAAGDCRG